MITQSDFFPLNFKDSFFTIWSIVYFIFYVY